MIFGCKWDLENGSRVVMDQYRNQLVSIQKLWPNDLVVRDTSRRLLAQLNTCETEDQAALMLTAHIASQHLPIIQVLTTDEGYLRDNVHYYAATLLIYEATDRLKPHPKWFDIWSNK